MWKIIIIICALGFDCQQLEQNPMQFYEDYNECMAVAVEKEKQLTELYRNYGYLVEDSKATCENVKAS
jgi:hypothetical protein